MKLNYVLLLLTGLVSLVFTTSHAAEEPHVFPPPHEEQQVPHAMHSAMKELPTIRVGQQEGDLIGHDNRALQAAVDYVAGLGGGIVEVGEGVYLMQDSLHLRSHVTVRGVPGKTILRKAASHLTPLALDGDFGEEQITLQDTDGFGVGSGVAIWDKNAKFFHITVARITGRTGNTFAIDKPLIADYMVQGDAQAATLFPVISGYDLVGARLENLVIDGNKESNLHLDGCRGAGIFLYRAFGTVIQDCVVRDYNGDGIGFQQSNDVQVLGCLSENNTFLGFHPGSGSQRPVMRECIARGNGTDGLFLCWRVRHGLFEDNLLEGNGRNGISIGHKDSDNLLQHNQIRLNKGNGVLFRNESLGMAAHRNQLVNNVIENNGNTQDTAAIRVRGQTNDLVFRENVIRDTREENQRTQTVGILVEKQVGKITFDKNQIEAIQPIEDRRTVEGE